MGIFPENRRIAIFSDLMLLLDANPQLKEKEILCKLKACLEIPKQPELERPLVAILAKYYRLDSAPPFDEKENSAHQFCINLIKELILRGKPDNIKTIVTKLVDNRLSLSVDEKKCFNKDENKKAVLLEASQYSLDVQQRIVHSFTLAAPDYAGVVDYAQRLKPQHLQDLLRHIVTTDPNCKDKLVLNRKETCWEIVAAYASKETFQIFLENHKRQLKVEDVMCMLKMAIQKNRFDTARHILNNEFKNLIDINAEVEKGATLLHQALKGDELEMIQLLLDHGAVPVHSSAYYQANPYKPSYTIPKEKASTTPDDVMPFLGGVRESQPRPSSVVKKSPLEYLIANLRDRDHFLIPLWTKAYTNQLNPPSPEALGEKLQKLLSTKIAFYNELALLFSKAHNLHKLRNYTAYGAAISLHHGLKQEADYYFANPTQCRPQDFQQRCQLLLAAGYQSELVRHRGVKQILGAIALAISGLATLGIGAVVFVLASKATTGKYLFFNHTDSKNTMNRIDSCVKQATA
jgi:hypothetical protein